ncbi:MAG TPA: DUF427 domain-containing protein [candidate division Zixibacteria bacterium]|nr:DUF427 domain-containing protein [candidate division Zixibacteria bacterium]
MAGSSKYTSGTEILAVHTIIEPSARWVRVQFNGEFIGNSKETLLRRESGGRLAYYFPRADVNVEHLNPRRLGSDGRQYFDVQVGDRIVEDGAWTYMDPPCNLANLRGFYGFQWNKMDHWFEEEEEIFAHPRDPYHRVDILRSTRHFRVELDGIILAETKNPTILFETSLPPRFYIPMVDVQMGVLEKTSSETTCPYKGVASYWSLSVAGTIYRNMVWAYQEPFPESKKIKGLLCFFNEKVDLFVDGELQERPETPWS